MIELLRKLNQSNGQLFSASRERLPLPKRAPHHRHILRSRALVLRGVGSSTRLVGLASHLSVKESNNAAVESKGDSSPKKKSRKLKRKKGSEEFTEAQKSELRNRESSDNSDSGGCWSGYESVEGKKKSEKGSCRKK